MSINIVGKTYTRPWGTYRTLAMNDGFQVKVISVKPAGQLSLQKHFKRSEHWVVVQGEPTVTLNDAVRTYHVDEAIYIPIEAIHRIENHTEHMVKMVEVQVGQYLGEDDIVRLDDVYDRAEEVT